MEWKLLKDFPAPDDVVVLVYQPSVEYAGGQKFDYYVCEAVKCRSEEGRFYSEQYNVILMPTHWCPLPEPPNRDVVKSPYSGPTHQSIFDVSST